MGGEIRYVCESGAAGRGVWVCRGAFERKVRYRLGFGGDRSVSPSDKLKFGWFPCGSSAGLMRGGTAWVWWRQIRYVETKVRAEPIAEPIAEVQTGFGGDRSVT